MEIKRSRMKYIVVLILELSANYTHAQNSIQITYEQIPAGYDSITARKIAKDNMKWRMIYNDSFALVYGLVGGVDKVNTKKSKVIGGKILHHSTFWDLSTNKLYEEVNYPKKDRFLIERDTLTGYEWQPLTLEKTILNYACKSALATNKDGKHIIVFYTTQLKFDKGYFLYKGAPGTILESIDQSWGRQGNHFVAVSIEEIEKTIEAPKNVEIITWEDYQRRKETPINKNPL